MKIKEEIFNILRQNYPLREVISDKVKTRVVNIERWATRKSIPSWYKDDVIAILKTELNFSDSDIFDFKNDSSC